MLNLVEQIGICVEKGKVDENSPYPADMTGMKGADEFTREAIFSEISPNEILRACNHGMHRIGNKFSRNEAYVPELLMSAKAMNVVMEHLKPFFQSGTVKAKGKFILGTVAGDLHDIGKNLVSMIIEGNGWKVIDLGVDVKTEKFISSIKENPDSVVGLSALLTTTMSNMSSTVGEIKAKYPDTNVIVGGAPLTKEAAEKMGADAYAIGPQEAVNYLNNIIPT